MKIDLLKSSLVLVLVLAAFAQVRPQSAGQSASEYAPDGVPVLIKNLPEPDAVRSTAVWARSIEEIESVVGPRPIRDLIEISKGTEAAVAEYPEGKVLLIEYATPQLSVDADLKFQERLAELGTPVDIAYRRIGNYSAFVFDAKDRESADFLLDQIRYAKTVQWLGEDPNYAAKVERYLALSTANIFIGTLYAIATGAAVAVGIGIVVGLVYFRVESRRRASRTAYSDAGGMTRLNLDELSEDIGEK
jgi:hypothetical protein